MRVTLSFKTIGCILLLFSIPSLPALAQQLPDSGSYDRSTAGLRRYVHEELGPDSRLYNGYEYIRNGIPAKGFPFFNSDSLQMGSLSYDGILYPEIPLEYDLASDNVVIHDYTGKALIGLINEKVDHFSIAGHSFRHIAGDKPSSNPPDPGFYEVLLSSGPTVLLARHEKKLIFPSNRDEMARYEANDAYYLFINDRYNRVDGKDALLQTLKDKKEELKKYIRTEKIRFSKHLETALIQTTAYYLQLSH